jgi:hypothetical protein
MLSPQLYIVFTNMTTSIRTTTAALDQMTTELTDSSFGLGVGGGAEIRYSHSLVTHSLTELSPS